MRVIQRGYLEITPELASEAAPGTLIMWQSASGHSHVAYRADMTGRHAGKSGWFTSADDVMSPLAADEAHEGVIYKDDALFIFAISEVDCPPAIVQNIGNEDQRLSEEASDAYNEWAAMLPAKTVLTINDPLSGHIENAPNILIKQADGTWLATAQDLTPIDAFAAKLNEASSMYLGAGAVGGAAPWEFIKPTASGEYAALAGHPLTGFPQRESNEPIYLDPLAYADLKVIPPEVRDNLSSRLHLSELSHRGGSLIFGEGGSVDE